MPNPLNDPSGNLVKDDGTGAASAATKHSSASGDPIHIIDIPLRAGNGAPAFAASLGDPYIRRDGTTGTWLYRCTTANTATTGAWTAVL